MGIRDAIRLARTLKEEIKTISVEDKIKRTEIKAPDPSNEESGRPYIDKYGVLIVSHYTDPKYHWWKRGGQGILKTLKELGAGEDVKKNYRTLH